MNNNQFIVMLYIFFWLIRINGCIRRGLQPLRRGREWFFDVHVGADFYEGAGRKLLHAYWMRMAIPFAIEIPLAIAIFVTGHLQWFALLILGLSVLIHINHSFSVNRAEQEARPLAIPETEQPVACLSSSLAPRRIRDYTNAKLEWALALSYGFAFLLLTRYYFAAPEHHNLRLVFGVPIFFLYLQLGMLFVKRVVLAWRAPVPQAQATEHMEAREQTRKYYVWVCDLQRVFIAAAVLFWPIRISVSPANVGRLMSAWFFFWMAMNLGSFVWIEIKRQQLLNLALRTQPVKLPDFLGQSDIARWPVCYQPSVPMLVLKGTRGYSLNLANTLAHLGAAYVAGLVAVIALLHMRQ